jgi:ankyrin repeat protein
VAKRSTGRGQGKGRRGRRRRGRTTPHIRHRSRAPRKHPVLHICSSRLVAHPPPLLAAVFHAQSGATPLHWAAVCSSSVAVVQALLAAYPEAAMATDNVRRPSPLAAWMRGPERSSEVIIGDQGQSGFIIRNQRALSGTQSHSVATRWAPQRPSAGPQRPSEVLSGSSEVLRSTQRHSEVIRDHSDALGGTQWHAAAIRGMQRAPSARGVHRPSPCVASEHPVPHICSTHLIAHPPSLIAAVFHAQDGDMPLHYAAMNSSSVAVVQALLAANPEAASATSNVRRPSPPAAWMRGPERSSEVIICNQGQSGVIIRTQRALSGTQRALSGTQSHSVATRWAPPRPSAGPSEAIRGTQWLIRGDQRYSEALRGHQRPLRATQSHSVAFSGTQRRSEGPRHAVFTAPRPA